MKKIFILTLVAIIFTVLILGGCSNSKVKTYELGIYDTKSQKILKLGDSRETIEKYIGSGNEVKEEYGVADVSCKYGDYVYNDLSVSDAKELTIDYDENGIAIAFSLQSCWDENDNRFELPSGINMLSTVTEFQEKYPEFIEVKNDERNTYKSEIHFKYIEDEFQIDEFNKEEYTTGLDEIYMEAIKKDESIGNDIEKIKKIQLEYMRKCAYISVYYYDYTEIHNIKVGYGWE